MYLWNVYLSIEAKAQACKGLLLLLASLHPWAWSCPLAPHSADLERPRATGWLSSGFIPPAPPPWPCLAVAGPWLILVIVSGLAPALLNSKSLLAQHAGSPWMTTPQRSPPAQPMPQLLSMLMLLPLPWMSCCYPHPLNHISPFLSRQV